ncbi:MAG: glycosyltransferase family 39 protein [Pacificimonas sp.]
MTDFRALVAGWAVPLSLLGIGAWGVFASLYFLIPGGGAGQWITCAVITLLVAFASVHLARRNQFSTVAIAPAEKHDGRKYVVLVTIIVAARLIPYFVFPADHWIDSKVYDELARTLAATGEYRLTGDYPFTSSRSYWPPGVVFLFAPFYALLGQERWIVLGVNIVLAVATMLLAGRVVRINFGERASLFVMAAIAIWPNHAYHAMFISKEYLSIALLLGAIALFQTTDDDRPAPWRSLLAGMMLGFATLAQPSQLLVILVFLIAFWLGRHAFGPIALRGILIAMGMALVILPWTARNYVLLGEAVLTNTANGISLLEGSQDGAGGDWIAVPPEIEFIEDELVRNRVAREAALEWIAENPGPWARNAIVKQLWLLGQSHRGVFIAVRDFHPPGSPIFEVQKIWSILFMLAIWAAMIYVASRMMGRPQSWFVIFAVGILAYFLIMHSVFGSGGRHQLIPGILAIMIAAKAAATRPVSVFTRSDEQRREAGRK